MAAFGAATMLFLRQVCIKSSCSTWLKPFSEGESTQESTVRSNSGAHDAAIPSQFFGQSHLRKASNFGLVAEVDGSEVDLLCGQVPRAKLSWIMGRGLPMRSAVHTGLFSRR